MLLNSNSLDLLILGAGGAGSNYARAAQSLGLQFAIVDSDQEKLARISQELEIATLTTAESMDVKFDYLALATPAGFRTAYLDLLSDRAPSGVLVEKLLARSHGELVALEKFQTENQATQFYTHTRWQLLDFQERVEAVAHEHGLGEKLRTYSHGSGMCLISGGVHWLIHELAERERIESTKEVYRLNGLITGIRNTRRFGQSLEFAGQLRLSNSTSEVLVIDYSEKGFTGPMTILEFEFGRILMNFNGAAMVSIAEREGQPDWRHYFNAGPYIPVESLLSDANPFERALLQMLNSGPSEWASAIEGTRMILDFLECSTSGDLRSEIFDAENDCWRIS